MKRSRFSEGQIIGILKEAEAGLKVADQALDIQVLKEVVGKKF